MVSKKINSCLRFVVSISSPRLAVLCGYELNHTPLAQSPGLVAAPYGVAGLVSWTALVEKVT